MRRKPAGKLVRGGGHCHLTNAQDTDVDKAEDALH